jgi:hypothetical protein
MKMGSRIVGIVTRWNYRQNNPCNALCDSGEAMPLQLYENQIPDLIGWFNNFIGFREIQKRIERVEMKIKDVGFDAPLLNRRYALHQRYLQIVRRNRQLMRIDIRDAQNNRILTSIAALRVASGKLDLKGNEKLKSRVRDAMGPDQDWRDFEHELRALVHYLGAGCDVQIMDDEENRFDLLVSRGDSTFEVECKTFSEGLGYQVSTDQSFMFFSALKGALNKNPQFLESGVLTITTTKRHDWNKDVVSKMLNDFVSSAPGRAFYPNAQIEFERNDRWTKLAIDRQRDEIIVEMYELFRNTNPHAMFVIGRERALMFNVTCMQRPRVLAGMLNRLKYASSQFSGARPSVIWVHFLGISQEDFSQIVQEEQRGGRSPFSVFANYIFRSNHRQHICRLRFSVDSEQTLDHPPSRLALPFSTRGFSTGGPAYDLTSQVSRFAPELTNV